MRKCAKEWRWSRYCVKESSHLCLGMANPGLHRDPCGFTQTEFDPDKTKSKRSPSMTVVLSNKHQEPLTSSNCKQRKCVSTYQTSFSFSKHAFLHARLCICSSSTHRCWACWCFWSEKAAPRVALCWTCCLKRSRIRSHRSSATSRTVPVRLASKACQSQNIATQLMQKQINMKKEMSTHSPSNKARGEKSSTFFIWRYMHAKNRQMLCLLIPLS